jgi:hypothetical protein
LSSGQRIDFTGFNVLRIGSGPWCVLFSPHGLTVGADIVVDVDHRLFVQGARPTSGTLVDVGMFALAATGGAAPSGQVTIDRGVWSFADTGYRAELVSAFDRFLQASEGLEKTTLQPGATEVLRWSVAQNVPATYAESLYLAHGVFSLDNPAQTYFDAQPGMRLRFDFENRQFVPPNVGAPVLSGFVGGPAVTADVVSVPGPSGAPRTGVDGFLSAVRLPPLAVAQGGFGDVVDLSAAVALGAASATARQPARGLRHLRFCYPARAFPGADSGGIVGPAGNIAVLGADDLTTLAAATKAYYTSGNAGAQLVGYFRGRTVVQPQIPVLVGGARPLFVPVGTTVRQLLERFAPMPRVPGFVDAGASAALGYQRRSGAVDVSALYAAGSYAPVTLAQGAADATGADPLELPVLAGDVFTTPTGPGHA